MPLKMNENTTKHYKTHLTSGANSVILQQQDAIIREFFSNKGL
jgi:hypothetical protein